MPHWLSDILTHPNTPADAWAIAGKTAVVYICLVVGLRVLGKRELGQMNIYDLVLIIVLANAVQNAMVGNDNSLVGGLIAAATLLILNRIFTYAMARSQKLEKFMVGEPVLIVNDGEILQSRCQREGITREQIMTALREHGIDKLEEAHMCVLEVDGSISVVPTGSAVHRSKRHYKALRLS
ncbi:MAG TPA: YetF domain-containing protein [Chthonomonadaceae bacterium]|nr:YetF domain-containing protein [Chthonomonadaceae bacterium]